ncbi:hypothetical protein [Prescottella agglutinans]|uniref:Uncharacterized protein n=1 Tax=Prescottella agglutinans TaxID=1644129 RepID=A0ABT6MGD5_9NOCA|nr:hypothetical protein [Prescottella agglutinans]MDH6282861.1 hypothetical protein [Prescottella agglutinans]
MSALSVESVSEVHQWGDLEPVRTDYDMRVDGRRVTLTPPSGDVPRFEACSACPKCDHLAVHGWREPRAIPPREVEIPLGVVGPTGEPSLSVIPILARFYESMLPPGIDRTPRTRKVLAYFVADESRFAVVRQCGGCGHEWGQA